MAGLIKNDREQSARVRRLLLNEVERLFTATELTSEETTTKKELLLRMAPNTMPRLHEVAGNDGEPIKYQLVSYADSQVQVPASPVPDTVNPSV